MDFFNALCCFASYTLIPAIAFFALLFLDVEE